MNKKNILLVLVLLGIFFLSGCVDVIEPPITEDVPEVDSTFEWVAQGDVNDVQLRISNPSSWEVEPHIFGERSNFIRPTRGEDDVFPELINVYVDDLFDFEMLNDRQKTLSEYTASVLTGFRDHLNNFNLIESSPAILAGNEAHQVLFTSYREDLGVEIMTKSIWAIKDNKAYSISYNAKRDTFYTYLPVANEMIESFEIN